MKSVANVAQSFIRMIPFADGPETETETQTEAELGDDREPSLFACKGCDSVYIALEKQTCSSCGSDVERTIETQ